MSDPLDARRAGELYVAAIERSRAGVARRVVTAAGELLNAAIGGATELSSVGDVVVRRLDDDAEVVRVTAGPSEEAALTIQTVREQLEHLSVDDFRARWGVDD
ncbi:hypothetical protein FE634_15015 [Nocardioides dongxiaopingii]|uniref:hypothetical protein n=1 Tax=Nocardioides TaxID=1839 RepID=UPI0010C76546|nr:MULTISPECIES: hypothetical protein [Nocardioides]QCW51388.1 hypothetical protein FE634_15015 [Nocardioides sp. S-1144]